jgi:hypothetical protein
VTGAGTVKVRMVPKARGKSLARHHKHKVKLGLVVTFTPSLGTARSAHFKGLHLPKRR